MDGKIAVQLIYLFVYNYFVEPGTMLRDARRRAALTQAEVAQRASTAQSAVAAYETGSRTPRLDTFRRLLGACDYEVEIVARPRMRRGASSLADVGVRIAQDLASDDEQSALRLIFGFADDFRGSSRPGQIELIEEEPGPTSDSRFDAILAATAEFFATEAQIAVPSWANDCARFVEPWWFVASRPAFHAYTLAHTPAVFARHGVFMAREVFDRV
jgi:transcriptional regulator with XRE-family HTH domain